MSCAALCNYGLSDERLLLLADFKVFGVLDKKPTGLLTGRVTSLLTGSKSSVYNPSLIRSYEYLDLPDPAKTIEERVLNWQMD